MSTWKVILAILAIFAAGLLTGATVFHKFAPQPDSRPWEGPSGGPYLPREVREDYVQRLSRDLKLSPAQKDRISKIVAESQQRVKNLYETIGPEMRDEMRQVRESVRAVLSPEQQRLFDDIRKRRHPHPGGPPSEGGRPRYRGSSSPAEKTNPPAQKPSPPPDSREPEKAASPSLAP